MKSNQLKILTLFSGGFSAFLGVLVILGWHIQASILLQVFPTFATMHYDTALCFILGGTGLLASAFKRSHVSSACGFAVSIFGFLTLIQSIGGINLGIEDLWLNKMIGIYPGSMDFYTALSFLFIGIAFLMLNHSHRLKHALLLASVLNSAVIGIGALVFFGYIAGIFSTHNWNALTQMAIHTSFGLIVLSSGIMALAWSSPSPHWFPIPVGVAVVTMSLFLGTFLHVQEEAYIQNDIKKAAQAIQNEIKTHIQLQALALQRMGHRWEVNTRVRKEWEADAKQYIQHQKGYQAIAWVDRSFSVQWLVTQPENKTLLKENLAMNRSQQGALEAARERSKATVIKLQTLSKEGQGFQISIPLFIENKFDGFILGLFHFQQLFDAITPYSILEQYDLEILDAQETIYQRYANKQYLEKWGEEVRFKIDQQLLRIRIWPRSDSQLIARGHTPLPFIPVIVGSLMALMLTFSLMLYQTSHRRLKEIEAIKGELESEIRERKRMEEEREQLIVELEAKNAEMERFTYTVSHDLKSPLITIRGFLDLLEKDAARRDEKRMQKDMDRIRSASEKMQQLLEELLKLSRIGRQVNAPVPISFQELVQEAMEMVAGRISQRGVHIHIQATSATLYGDRPRLLEVLQNLIDNAVKYMGDQPMPSIQIGSRQEGDRSVCYIQDNGMGIEPLYHEKVFNLFERLDTETEGTGIGLALVKRIVEVHGGQIWIVSEGHGQGSCFYFTLPIQELDHYHC